MTHFETLRIETEGESVAGEHETRTGLLWERIVTPWWSLRAGARHERRCGQRECFVCLRIG